MNSTYVFPCVFTYEDDQISITFPDLLGCVSCGATEQEAIENAKEALSGHLLCMKKDHDPIPSASDQMDIALGQNETTSLIAVLLPSP